MTPAETDIQRDHRHGRTAKQENIMRSLAKWIAAASYLALVGCQPAETTPDAGPIGPTEPGAVITQPEPALPFDADQLQAAGLKVYWEHSLELEAGEQTDRIFRLDEKFYCLTNTNMLIAVSARVGLPKWRHPIASPGQTVFAPTHVDDVALLDEVYGIGGILDPESVPAAIPFDAVMINTLSYVLVLDRKDGRVVRGPNDVRFNFAANTSGVSNGPMFFVGGIDGRFRALDLVFGVQAWVEGTTTMGMITSSLQYADAKLYVGTEGGEFVATDITTTRSFGWRRSVDGPISADFAVSNGQCFVPSEDRRLYAISAVDGKDIWDAFIASGELRTPVQVSPATIFQYAHDDRLYAINRLTGKERWNMPDGRTILAVMDGKVYVLDKDKIMHVVDEETGEVSASMDMNGLSLLLANTATPAIYATTTDGRAFCFRTLDAGHLTPAMLEEDINPR